MAATLEPSLEPHAVVAEYLMVASLRRMDPRLMLAHESVLVRVLESERLALHYSSDQTALLVEVVAAGMQAVAAELERLVVPVRQARGLDCRAAVVAEDLVPGLGSQMAAV